MNLEANTPEPKKTPEDLFRSVLEDVAEFVANFAPFCSTPAELAGIARHALENPGQLKMLMAVVQSNQNRKR